MNILVFDTEQECGQALAIINQIAAGWWVSQGYTVIDDGGVNELIGKNAATGEDAPDKMRTTTWDVVKQSPTGTFYIIDPADNPNFVDWRQYLPQGVTFPDAVPFPPEWLQEIEP